MMNPSNSIFHSEKGLTLLEIMISIVLLAFVMLGVVAIIDNSQNTKDRVIIQDRDNLQVETAISRMMVDLSQIWSPLYFSQRFMGNLDPNINPGIEEVRYLYEGHPRLRGPSRDGVPIPFFQLRAKDDFIFLTSSHRRRLENQAQSHFVWIRYFIGESQVLDESSGQVLPSPSLLRQVFPDDPWAKEELPLDSTRSSVLLENVQSLEFKFWNITSRRWEDNLRSIQDGESLIRGVRITLKWKDSTGLERETVRFFRPLWPAVMIQDPLPNQAGMAGGQQAGAQGGIQGQQQGGQPGGFNGDDE
jgi:hypothetical protein